MNVVTLPGVALSSKVLALSAVTVWASLSMFITLTSAPGFTEAGTAYLNFSIMIIAAAAGIDDDGAGTAVLLVAGAVVLPAVVAALVSGAVLDGAVLDGAVAADATVAAAAGLVAAVLLLDEPQAAKDTTATAVTETATRPRRRGPTERSDASGTAL